MRCILGTFPTVAATLIAAVFGLAACGHSGSIGSAKTTDVSGLGEGEKLDIDHDQDASKPDGDERALPFDSDEDADNPTAKPGHDSDDDAVFSFGHSADKSARAQISNLARRYLAIAASENGAAACAVIYSPYAESLPETYGTSPPGPAFAHGKTCPEVLTHVFAHYHNEIVTQQPKLKVTAVRVKERAGLAVLSFGGLAGRELRFEREGKIWRVLGTIASKFP